MKKNGGRKVISPELLRYCTTDYQREIIELYMELGTSRAVGEEIGIKERTVRAIVASIEANAAKKGMGFDGNIPDGYRLRGRSTLVDADGNTKIEWVKTEVDKERMQEMMREITQELAQGVKPWPVVKKPAKTTKDLCTVYTITDYHIGAYAFKDETGDEWDLEIAENTLYQGISDMMAGSPDSEQAIFCQMGDFLHWDGLSAVTPLSKHSLDGSGRYSELVQLAVETCLKTVEMLLRKHKNVHVIMCEGNHDIAGSLWLQAIMKIAFKDNKRVTVDESVFPYYKFKWGKVFLGWHHGHLTKITGLAGKFFSEPRFRQDMSDAEYIYLSTGHLHTKELMERSGAVLERHPTLSAKDSYAARGFEHTQRGALAITYDKDRGETSRVTVVPVG
jgi:hypothetical protein